MSELTLKQKINYWLVCPYCSKRSSYVDSKVLYSGKSYWMVYCCFDCQAWVGVHKIRWNKKALGRLANKTLRMLKVETHEYFDWLWTAKMKKANCSKFEARTKAYCWLSTQMSLPLEETHIGMFDEEQCKKAIEICKKCYTMPWD